ncbi:GNAT family N-acetyltransferase [candidate division KSB1 bacterium]|nr:GNAT family N-acetyltransferase [candidate division KSB1 bacterium]NIR68762.1 GNAT family N-acetyltransferase [candidate division KSB1 bacterium]NIS25578.1 GNAT family N-acetyltransferase [candidate division KSB1 bacterium]NIT72472.1 GNAT family N-acetyltransferase [candidate division KSB1 bacterium]NIU26256.1 GNAT family N-acetyltransferase [candidate division KSB1 bacterium]
MKPDFLKLALTLPDIPRWVETRGLLLAGRCEVYGATYSDDSDFVVRSLVDSLICVVGRPNANAILQAISQSGSSAEVLTARENVEYVGSVLKSWHKCKAWIHSLNKDTEHAVAADATVKFVTGDEIFAIRDEAPELGKELSNVLTITDVAAAIVRNQPVSFCYAGTETETLWDISIDTLPRHRRRGYAATCVQFMIDFMRTKGKQPVWGAVDSNVASLNLARKLGFQVVDELFLFSKPVP